MSFPKKLKFYTKEQAFLKAQKYCAYQERCQQEVINKLYEWHLHENDAGEITASLIEQDFINEERFAKLFAGGKFRIKKWGRIKIKNELKKKEVSDYCIGKGLSEIDERDYLQTLKSLISKKEQQLKFKNAEQFEMNSLLADYLIGKGYEADLVWETLKKK